VIGVGVHTQYPKVGSMGLDDQDAYDIEQKHVRRIWPSLALLLTERVPKDNSKDIQININHIVFAYIGSNSVLLCIAETGEDDSKNGFILDTSISGNPKSRLMVGIAAAIAATLKEIVTLPKQSKPNTNFLESIFIFIQKLVMFYEFA